MHKQKNEFLQLLVMHTPNLKKWLRAYTIIRVCLVIFVASAQTKFCYNWIDKIVFKKFKKLQKRA